MSPPLLSEGGLDTVARALVGERLAFVCSEWACVTVLERSGDGGGALGRGGDAAAVYWLI